MSTPGSGIEMYAALDPRITALNALRDGEWPIPAAPPTRDHALPQRDETDEAWHRWDWVAMALCVVGALAVIAAIAVPLFLPSGTG